MGSRSDRRPRSPRTSAPRSPRERPRSPRERPRSPAGPEQIENLGRLAQLEQLLPQPCHAGPRDRVPGEVLLELNQRETWRQVRLDQGAVAPDDACALVALDLVTAKD